MPDFSLVLGIYWQYHTSYSEPINLKLLTLSPFSASTNISWLKQTDAFGGPNCLNLIKWARERNDHRSLRLLGVDDNLERRANSGFQEADEKRWEMWLAEDAEALKPGSDADQIK